VDPDILRKLQKAITHHLPLPVRIQNPKPLPAHAYHPIRRQYLSTGLLQYLLEEDRDNSFRLLGLTTEDLYIPIFTFVFGEAQLEGKAAVISLYRPAGGDGLGRPPRQLLIERLTKLGLHELGHTFGLGHCRQPGCLMAFSPTLEKLDANGLEPCSYCQILLKDFFDGLKEP
jgi:archaemetzincin